MSCWKMPEAPFNRRTPSLRKEAVMPKRPHIRCFFLPFGVTGWALIWAKAGPFLGESPVPCQRVPRICVLEPSPTTKSPSMLGLHQKPSISQPRHPADNAFRQHLSKNILNL